MYRKRNQITEMMICLVDALVVVFCLTVAGKSKGVVQYYTGLAYSKLLFPEGVQWVLQTRSL